MLLWRISNYVDLTGLGGERSSGRWHTAAHGKRIVYLTEHPAVALLETIANLHGDPELFPDDFQLLKIEAPDTIAIGTAKPPNPHKATSLATRSFGDAWLAAGSTALLRVPSVPSPESWNYLLNPLHPDAAQLKIQWAKHIAYDKRLFHLSR